MKISIVIPVYNGGQYIEKAIDSVLAQSYPNKELIVFDAGSNDETVSILKSYGDRIFWISEKDKGQWDAINKGLYRASGGIFAYLNADDWYEPEIFSRVVDIFSADPNVMFVYGNCRLVSPDGVKISIPPAILDREKLIMYGNLTPQPATFFRTDALLKEGGIAEFHYMMEYDMNLKVLKNGTAYFIDMPLANFLVRSDQKSRVENEKAIVRECIIISRANGGSYYSPLYLSYIYNYYLPPFLQKIVMRVKKIFGIRLFKKSDQLT